MRRPLLVAAGVALFAAVVASSGTRQPEIMPQPVLADTNGICTVNPSPLPTVGPNVYTPVLPGCSPSRHLQVDVLSGGGGNAPTAPPAFIYASPYPSLSPGAQTAGDVDSSGRIILSPASSITVSTPPPPFTYASPYPTLTPGAMTASTVDSNGFQIISPLTITRGAVGEYQVNPSTLIDGQSTQILTDINGRPQVAFATPQPVYLAPEASRFQQRGAPFYSSTVPQLFADADVNRRGLYIQNLCPNAIWLSLFGDSVTLDSYPNIEIRPGQLYTTEVNFTPTSAIYVFSRSTSCGFAGATY